MTLSPYSPVYSVPALIDEAVRRDTLVMADDQPVDETGFNYARLIPGDAVEPWCEHLDREAPATSRCMECEPA